MLVGIHQRASGGNAAEALAFSFPWGSMRGFLGVGMNALFHLLFFASGFSGLLYEIVWARQLATVFGVSAFALTAVLSAYFLGMAIGAWWIGRLADRVERPLAVYGAIEAGVSILAVAITLVLPHLDRVILPALDALEGHFLLQSGLRFAAALAVLVAPTVLLGATLPVLARGLVARETLLGGGVARLYAVNTAGAVAGVLAAGFVLIPWIGLRGTAFLGAALGLVVAATARVASRRIPAVAARPAGATLPPAPASASGAVLLAFGLSGFGALALEIIVTRLLIQLSSSGTLVFAAMLATFLTGIALGSALAGRIVDRVGAASAGWLALVESGVGASAVLSVWLFAIVQSAVTEAAWFAGEAHDTMVRTRFAFLAAAVTFAAPTLLLGASFPLAARAYLGLDALGTRLGRLYGANTLGGVFGSFAAGFLLIPWLGVERSLQAVALLFCAIGAGLALAARGLAPRLRAAGLVAAAAAALIVLGLPPRFAEDWTLARSQARRLIHLGEDYHGTIAVVERQEGGQDFRQLLINGDFMSGTSNYARRYMRLAAHIPALLAAEPPRSGLVICFGVGITLEALTLHPTLERATVVELSQEVLASSRFFEEGRRMLADPRVHAVVEDGRQYLLRHPEARFDVITLEPPPPPSAGVANLYSRDFYHLARQRLTPGGVMAQWIPIATQTPATTRALVRAFLDEFPHAALFWTESLETLVVGSDRPLHMDLARVRTALADPRVGPDLRAVGVHDAFDFAADYLLGEAELAAWLEGAPAVTDDRPLVEYAPAGALASNWRVLEELLRLRPPPAEVAARFGFEPREVPLLAARTEQRLHERVQVRQPPAPRAAAPR